MCYNQAMNKSFWYGSIAALAVIDLWCGQVKREGTLSQASRELFRTNTPAGKAAWIIAWGGFTAWLVPHISNWPENIEHIIDEIS